MDGAKIEKKYGMGYTENKQEEIAMHKIFNISADCKPDLHYMVDLKDRLKMIKKMVDRGDYFTINRARQYGKTTTLKALSRYLSDEYAVINLDFQKLSHKNFMDESAFVKAISSEIVIKAERQGNVPEEILEELRGLSNSSETDLMSLFRCFTRWCKDSVKPVVLMIDEVDSATNNQVFLDFLAQLRGCYIDRDEMPAFQSVILAGVYDVKNLKRKFVSDEDHKMNSPWNIAADFSVDMSFSASDIEGMLKEYEDDYRTGMNIEEMSSLIYDYTSGYPFLVSRLCKLLDECVSESGEYCGRHRAWTKEGFLKAVRLLLLEKNTLFESLINRLAEYPKLREMLYSILFVGERITFNPDNQIIDMAAMFGFIKNVQGTVAISNRIFEIRLYNLFLSEEEMNNNIFKAGIMEKNQFLENGFLNMDLVLEKFVLHWGELYGSEDQKFIEENGRKLFLLYLKPIINGNGNYYIEARTRDNRRTDVIVDYRGKQFIVELKIWRGNAYHERGEEQLLEYLDYYHLKKGYMLSFNFNKKKETGVNIISIKDKILVEATV